MDPEEVWDFVSWLLLVTIWGMISLVICCKRVKFYRCIKKPDWYPCNSYFEYLIVLWWLVVYTLLAWSGYRIWSYGGWDVNTLALMVFVINVIMFHTIYFVYLVSNSLFVILSWAIVLSIICVVNFVLFIIIDVLAALLLLPFFFTILMYAALSYSCYCINPHTIVVESTHYVSHSNYHHHNNIHINDDISNEDNSIIGKNHMPKKKEYMTMDVLKGLES